MTWTLPTKIQKNAVKSSKNYNNPSKILDKPWKVPEKSFKNPVKWESSCEIVMKWCIQPDRYKQEWE